MIKQQEYTKLELLGFDFQEDSLSLWLWKYGIHA